MMRFTKAIRQKIVEDFARRNNGVFNPTLFVEEVRAKGADHPAHEWFEWDVEKAALAYQVDQAREFARDLRITFTVEEIHRGAVRVREAMMPLVLSPVEGRRDGGGYLLTDPNDPEHVAEHSRQAATALRAWFDRYEEAARRAGIQPGAVEKMAAALDKIAVAEAEAA